MAREKKIVQGQGIAREFQFFSEGIFKSSNGIREKRNVKSAYLVFFLYFYCFLLFDFFFVHLTDMNLVVLVEYWSSENLNDKLILGFQENQSFLQVTCKC